jgi:hypothetical protein
MNLMAKVKEKLKYKPIPCVNCISLPICKNIMLSCPPAPNSYSLNKTTNVMTILNKCDVMVDYIFSQKTYFLNRERLDSAISYILDIDIVEDYYIDVLFVHAYLIRPYVRS